MSTKSLSVRKPVDKILVGLSSLILLSLGVYFIGNVFNNGDGWPVTRNGANVVGLLIPVTLLYMVVKPLLSRLSGRHQLILSVAALVLAVVLAIVGIALFFGWALSGVGF